MGNRFERLNYFLDRIKSLTFWQRVFAWKSLKSLSYDAYGEFKSLVGEVDRMEQELDRANTRTALLEKDNEHLKSNNDSLENDFRHLREQLDEEKVKTLGMSESIASKDERIRQVEARGVEQEKEIVKLKEKHESLSQEASQLRQENAVFKQTEIDRKTKHEKDISTLNSITERVQNERRQEKEELRQVEVRRFESMKETWATHEGKVKHFVKSICQRHIIEYVEVVPFKGSPDNTIKIAGEYIVFDAKSPASDDLNNFPTYIKNQTESVRKYVKEENVRRDVFLVVPSNTVDVIEQFSHNMADYNVYVVTLDVLEPLILSLKKLEDYEFVNQLTPEERENICRVIGKFAHMAKRRIQIDHFFAWEFLDILTKCKVDLPKDILEKVIEFEKSEKLNPPQERRAKQILTKDLESDNDKIQREAEAKEVVFPPSLQRDLRGLPLFEGDESS